MDADTIYEYLEEIVVPGYGEVKGHVLQDAVSEARYWLDKNIDPAWLYAAYAVRLREMQGWRSGDARLLLIEIERRMIAIPVAPEAIAV